MEAHLVLAGTLRAMGDLQAAEQAYRVAAALRSDRAETHSDLATLLGEMRRFAEAMERHRRAIALNGDSPLLHRAQASTLERMGDLAGAEAAYTQAITRSPLDLTSWLSRGACLAGLGRFAEADACFTRVIQADPAAMAAHWQRARIHTLPDAAEPALRSALADPATTPMRAVFAGFALAPLLEGQHRHDDAFAVIAEANARFRALRAAAGQSFDPDRLDAEIDTLIAATPASLFQRLSSWAVETELPVFLVGMPRSGISLVEQILASHPEVHAAGPLHRMAALNALLAGENPDRPNLADWDPVLARKTAEDHLAGLSRLGAGKARVVDATPDNILLLGLIAALFPRARVVLCTRGRRDLCVSNLFTLFTEGNLFSRDLAHCARRAAALDQLTAHWRAVLPLRMHEIRYEELVTRPEPAIRGLLEFLALDWHPGCMEFHTTDRPVLSAPVWEVRQPLTARGIGRARPYSAQLDGSGL